MTPRMLRLCLMASICFAGSAQAASPRVVASIAPLHSLTAAVMEGIGVPDLLVPGTASDHDFALKPSDVRKISEADLVIWIGEALETYLERPLQTEAVANLEVIEAAGIDPHPYGAGAEHAHGDAEEGHEHAHEAAEEGHDHTADEEEEHKHAAEEQGGGEHAGHTHSHAGLDPHVWLDPVRAQAIVQAIAAKLAELDPEHADAYRQNAAAAIADLQALDGEVRTALAPLGDRAFITFHDGYSYFVQRYGLRQAGELAVDPERRPGAATMRALREKVASDDVACAFAEPQFDQDVIATIAGEAGLKVGTLDAIGAGLTPGPELYAALIRQNVDAIKSCLAPNS